MNHDEHALKRLLKSASRSRTETPDDAMPFELESRILANWRRDEAEDDSVLLASLFRRAVICAGVVMVVSIGWSQFASAREVPGAAALTNFEEVIRVVP